MAWLSAWSRCLRGWGTIHGWRRAGWPRCQSRKRPKVWREGVYTSAAEALDAATTRKFDYCYEKLRLKPGDHILEVGPGWGAWLEYASRRGVKCTGISISQSSIDYLKRRAQDLGHD